MDESIHAKWRKVALLLVDSSKSIEYEVFLERSRKRIHEADIDVITKIELAPCTGFFDTYFPLSIAIRDLDGEDLTPILGEIMEAIISSGDSGVWFSLVNHLISFIDRGGNIDSILPNMDLLLECPSSRLRRQAVLLLEYYLKKGNDIGPAVEKLVDLTLHDPSEDVQSAAAWLLAGHCLRSTDIRRPLIALSFNALSGMCGECTNVLKYYINMETDAVKLDYLRGVLNATYRTCAENNLLAARETCETLLSRIDGRKSSLQRMREFKHKKKPPVAGRLRSLLR